LGVGFGSTILIILFLLIYLILPIYIVHKLAGENRRKYILVILICDFFAFLMNFASLPLYKFGMVSSLSFFDGWYDWGMRFLFFSPVLLLFYVFLKRKKQ
jgi:hypothetical protein